MAKTLVKLERPKPNTNLQKESLISPVTQSDGHDFPRLIDELVPGEATMIDYVGVGLKKSCLRAWSKTRTVDPAISSASPARASKPSAASITDIQY